MLEHQRVGRLYLAQPQELSRSADPADQALSAKVEACVKEMPRPVVSGWLLRGSCGR